METLYTVELLDFTHSIAGEWLAQFTYPWEALAGIGEWVAAQGIKLDENYEERGSGIWIEKTAQIAETATLHGPCIIGPRTEVRPGAFLRGNILVGADCVVGNSTELKNVILFDRVQVPHYNYVGDSILGYRAHMGAGSITSNVKADKSLVQVKWSGGAVETGRKKFGAILGDFCEVGCNAVLNPGTVLGRGVQIYPLTSVRGYVPAHHICKSTTCVVQKHLDESC